MEAIDSIAFEKMRRWVWRNARPLELALWRCLYENASKNEVILALSAYQNEDGGFGHGIDCDCWNPESSPYNTMHALRLLRLVGITDTSLPIIKRLIAYLEATPYRDDMGWVFSIPSNLKVPHAIWWEYDKERNALETPGVTAPICGFALRYVPHDASFYKLAKELTVGLLNYLDTNPNFGDMGIAGYRVLLEDIEAAGLVSEFCGAEKWERYKAQIGAEKEMFEDDDSPLLPEGVWDIPWEWYNGGKYPDEWAVSKNWWKSRRCIERLSVLEKEELFCAK